jgi:hypothetical protein
VKINASNEAPAKLFGIGREGAGACTMVAHFTQRFFGRMCRVTVNVTVFTSSTSASSLPRPFSAPPQTGQAHSFGWIRFGIRSKCSGNCLRRMGWPLGLCAALIPSDALWRSASARAALISWKVSGSCPAPSSCLDASWCRSTRVLTVSPCDLDSGTYPRLDCHRQ